MRYICIEGNIGSGKTSLAKKLAVHFDAEFIAEEFEDNPFLPLFYKEPEKFAFALEFSFLLDRARQLSNLRQSFSDKMHVSDYYIEKCLYFAKINLNKNQFAEFEKAFPSVASLVPPPDLLVYLHLSEEDLLKNISKRGRIAERQIDKKYLQKINAVYLERSKGKRHFPVINFFIAHPSEKSYQAVFDEIVDYIKNPPEGKNVNINC